MTGYLGSNYGSQGTQQQGSSWQQQTGQSQSTAAGGANNFGMQPGGAFNDFGNNILGFTAGQQTAQTAQTAQNFGQGGQQSVSQGGQNFGQSGQNSYGQSWSAAMNSGAQTANTATAFGPNSNTGSDAQAVSNLIKPMFGQFAYSQSQVSGSFAENAGFKPNPGYGQYQGQQAFGQNLQPPTVIPLPVYQQNPQASAAELARLAAIEKSMGEQAQRSEIEFKGLQSYLEALNKKFESMNEEQKRYHAQAYQQAQEQARAQAQEQVRAQAHSQQTAVNNSAFTQPVIGQGIPMVTSASGFNLTGFQMAGQLPVTGKLDAYGRQEVDGEVQATGTIRLKGFVDTRGQMDTQGTLATQGNVQAIPQGNHFQMQMPMQQFQPTPAPHFQSWEPPQLGRPGNVFESAQSHHNMNPPLLAGAGKDDHPFFSEPPVPLPASQFQERSQPQPHQNDAQVSQLVDIMREMSKKIDVLEQSARRPQKSVSFKDGEQLASPEIDEQSFTTSLGRQMSNYVTMTTAESFIDQTANHANQQTTKAQSRSNSTNRDTRSNSNNRLEKISKPQSRQKQESEYDDNEDFDDVADDRNATYPSRRPRVYRSQKLAPVRAEQPVVYAEARPVVVREPVVVAPARRKRLSYVPVERVVTDMVPVVEDDYVDDHVAIRSRSKHFPIHIEGDFVGHRRRGSYQTLASKPVSSPRYVDENRPGIRNSIYNQRGSTYYPNVTGSNISYGPTRTAQFFNQSPLVGDYSAANNNYSGGIAKSPRNFSGNTTSSSTQGNNPDITRAIRNLVESQPNPSLQPSGSGQPNIFGNLLGASQSRQSQVQPMTAGQPNNFSSLLGASQSRQPQTNGFSLPLSAGLNQRSNPM